MAYQLLTCPESAHLELIEYVDDSLGTLVVACSAFRPACAVECPRTCAARLDQRASRHGAANDAERETALIRLRAHR